MDEFAFRPGRKSVEFPRNSPGTSGDNRESRAKMRTQKACRRDFQGKQNFSSVRLLIQSPSHSEHPLGGTRTLPTPNTLVIGSLYLGASRRGVDMGPSAMTPKTRESLLNKDVFAIEQVKFGAGGTHLALKAVQPTVISSIGPSRWPAAVYALPSSVVAKPRFRLIRLETDRLLRLPSSPRPLDTHRSTVECRWLIHQGPARRSRHDLRQQVISPNVGSERTYTALTVASGECRCAVLFPIFLC
jgi:hypothetical protein